jgi:16S rRNA (adenine1518-N6/adenine1519-N6)-dimethyltransferase|tara:strand:+ start:174 stop:950 length:777 start_codon:yes stop_codon:yes gene_type:complete
LIDKIKKKWGQHFLADTNLLKKLVKLIDPLKSDSLLEIGPGGGALTELLDPYVKDLIGVEVDKKLFNKLSSRNDLVNSSFINEDFLKLDLSTLVFQTRNIRLVGNLPYNISSQIIFRLLEKENFWRDCHFMVQKEVGERMAALPGSKTYGRLSVNIQAVARVKTVLKVPAEVFVPKPSVESSLVRIKPLSTNLLNKEETNILYKITRLAFGQRRKMLRNSLASIKINNSILDLSQRPEMLSISEFKRLARWVASRKIS